jgi:hypothetical protein
MPVTIIQRREDEKRRGEQRATRKKERKKKKWNKEKKSLDGGDTFSQIPCVIVKCPHQRQATISPERHRSIIPLVHVKSISVSLLLYIY